MCTENLKDFSNLSTMPYSLKNREFNHHSMWHLPGVKQANALEEKLNSHPYFKKFKIINAAGNQTNGTKALNKLRAKIYEVNNNPLKT